MFFIFTLGLEEVGRNIYQAQTWAVGNYDKLPYDVPLSSRETPVPGTGDRREGWILPPGRGQRHCGKCPVLKTKKKKASKIFHGAQL